jgi:transketolase
MLNQELKLSEKIFSDEIEQEPTRDGFGKGLLVLGEENAEVVVLSADVAASTRCHWFAEKFPERFFQIGVGEQNMAAVAAGLGVSGKIPFISAYAVFSPGRNWEQIRTTIAYNDANVKIAGHHAGFLAGPDGGTHQALEDIALMRVIPNMKVIVPCDAVESKKAVSAVAKISGPAYVRVSREKSAVMTTEETPFVPGKAEIFWSPPVGGKKPQAAIIGCGPILYNALLAAKELEDEGISTIVLNSHTIKPLDENKIIEAAKKCGAIVAVEEHSVLGGLGSAISELLAKTYPVPVEFVGSKDVFGESAKPEELIKKYGLEAKDIKEAVKRVLKRNK